MKKTILMMMFLSTLASASCLKKAKNEDVDLGGDCCAVIEEQMSQLEAKIKDKFEPLKMIRKTVMMSKDVFLYDFENCSAVKKNLKADRLHPMDITIVDYPGLPKSKCAYYPEAARVEFDGGLYWAPELSK